MGAHKNSLAEAILMSTQNIGFYEDLTKIIFQLHVSSNFIKYTPYLFFCEIQITSNSPYLLYILHVFNTTGIVMSA